LTHNESSDFIPDVLGRYLGLPRDLEWEMAGDRSDIVAIMAAIIYAGRTGESAQAPNEKVFGVIAKAAWDLHKAVVAGDDVHVGKAGFQQP
jgi:hypothetical protein